MTAAVQVTGESLRAEGLADAFEAMAAMVRANPGLACRPGLLTAFERVLVAVHGDDAREVVEALAQAAAEHGGQVRHDVVSDDTWASITVDFGPVGLWVFGRREQLVDGHPVDGPVDECDGAAP